MCSADGKPVKTLVLQPSSKESGCSHMRNDGDGWWSNLVLNTHRF